VPFPEAEPVVGEYRLRLDATAALGIPPHVTLVYPFMPPASINMHVVSGLLELLALVEPVPVTLATIGWFGTDVVFLRPEPAGWFIELARRISNRWPQWQPYGGAFDEIVPHLTIAHGDDTSALREAARDISTRLPITSKASAVELIETTPTGRWAARHSFRLGR